MPITTDDDETAAKQKTESSIMEQKGVTAWRSTDEYRDKEHIFGIGG